MLNDFGIVLENTSLKNYNTYGIETTAKYLIKVESEDKLLSLIKYLKENNLKYMILGKGSNVILPDKPFNGVIISLELMNNINFNKNIVEAESGIVLSLLAKKVMAKGLSGLEYVGSIPGTLGGALFGNAGVKDHDIYEFLKSVTIIRNNKILKLNKEDIKYSYRNSEFKENKDIIISAVFEFKEGNIEEMENILKDGREKRLKSQPLEYRNAGSVFKNPEGDYAGRLIEACNLKGYRINDAMVSEKHANFIVNIGNATSNDIKKLIKRIKKDVKNKFNIDLEEEQIIVNW